MIRGIGCDVVSIARIRRALERERFARRILSPQEQELMAHSADGAEFAAGRWAAKEAVVKALGTGFSACEPAEISVERDSGGAPRVRLTGRAAALLRPGDRLHVTVSHEKEYAAAFALLEGEQDEECSLT